MWLVEPITDVFFPAGGEDCEAVKLMQLRGAAVQEILGGAPPLCPARRPGRGNGFQSVLPLQMVKREAAAQRRKVKTGRKNSFSPAKRQAVWFETLCVSN